MKNNIILPLITAGLETVIGIILSFFGFDFKLLFSGGALKEFVFSIVFVIILTAIIVYDILINKIRKTNEELKRSNEQLSATEESLQITKSELDNLMKSYHEFQIHNALKNYKEDNSIN